MGEIRCSLCGKANPDDIEVCQHCQARLKPLIAPESTESKAPPPEETGLEEPVALEGSETPDWLQGLRQDDDIPEWNLEEASDEPDVGMLDPEEYSDEVSADLPDWIAEADKDSGQKLSKVDSQARPSIEPGPEPNALPDWLESLRSGVKGAPGPTSSQPTEPVESAGPLAGLRGVLAADALISRARGPATRPTKLRISANQLVHVDLLKELVESEGKPQPLPQKRAISSEHILRWGIALVVCLAVLWSILYPGQPAALPVYQEETAELNRLIEQLPAEGRVLVAFDYEPGLFAELDAAAHAVIDHLMVKGSFLTLISSMPFGPILAERFIDEQLSDHHYTSGEQYINLGYIPGGTASLAALTGNLSRILPFTIEGEEAWGNGSQPSLLPLEGIQNISDYDLILVLVDDPDVARAWLEQVGTFLSESTTQGSLGMATSAQLEPVVRPYFDANPRQLHGFVAGMRGGASYARLNGREDLTRSLWDPFGMGLFIAVLLMLVAGLIYVTYPMLARPTKPKNEVKG